MAQRPLFDEDFDGATYDRAADHERLGGQMVRVLKVMMSGRWTTLNDLAAITEAPHASVSAQLRNLRKRKFGGYRIDRRHVKDGLYEYRLVLV